MYVQGSIYTQHNYTSLFLMQVAINGTGQGEFLLNNSLLGKFAELFCIAPFRDICMKMIFLVSGPSIDNLNTVGLNFFSLIVSQNVINLIL